MTWTARCLGVLVVATAAASTRAPAQTVLYACYVPNTGTVYRIKTTNTSETCKSNVHVEFSWTDAVGADHGALTGLADDDHPLYLLTNGVRNATNGFAVTGTQGTGTIPATGGGVRLMWYPGKAAFRAGGIVGDDWDDANIGPFSTAMGGDVTASGDFSTAMGFLTRASGTGATAMGANTLASANGATAMGGTAQATGLVATAMGGNTTASGSFATAMGDHTTASGARATAMGNGTSATGANSTAMGENTTASGPQSTAMGANTTAAGAYTTAMGRNAHTLNQIGSFVYGDASSTSLVTPTAFNQFIVRAAGGTRFFSDADLDFGVWLAPGAGAWAAISDVNRKAHFRDVDGEAVLSRIARLSIREWSYKSQDSTVRHLGPTAQDFHAAFGLGESDTTITTTDIDGVNLLAVQTLERRTARLVGATRGLQGTVAELQAENRRLRAESSRQRDLLRRLDARTSDLEALRAELATLRAELKRARRPETASHVGTPSPP